MRHEGDVSTPGAAAVVTDGRLHRGRLQPYVDRLPERMRRGGTVELSACSEG